MVTRSKSYFPSDAAVAAARAPGTAGGPAFWMLSKAWTQICGTLNVCNYMSVGTAYTPPAATTTLSNWQLPQQDCCLMTLRQHAWTPVHGTHLAMVTLFASLKSKVMNCDATSTAYPVPPSLERTKQPDAQGLQ